MSKTFTILDVVYKTVHVVVRFLGVNDLCACNLSVFVSSGLGGGGATQLQVRFHEVDKQASSFRSRFALMPLVVYKDEVTIR
jgi:hypothetical protein